MQTDENEILEYLKSWPGAFVSAKEIARKVGGKERCDEDRGWALPILAQMVRDGLLETDQKGAYRLKIEERKKERHEPQHISPQLLKILKSSGRSFEGVNFNEAKHESPIPAYRKPGSTSDSTPDPAPVPKRAAIPPEYGTKS